MISSRKRLVIVELIAIGTPVVLVYLGRMLLASPEPSSTTIPVAAPTLMPVPTVQAKPLTPEQLKAAEWVKQLMKTPLASPLNHPVEVVIKKPVVVEPDQVLPPPPPRESPIQGLKLTAVMGNDDGQLASINGKIFRIGDDVRTGLRLTGIDARNSLITLETRSGEQFVIKREQAELKK
jgi:hypothetical protein